MRMGSTGALAIGAVLLTGACGDDSGGSNDSAGTTTAGTAGVTTMVGTGGSVTTAGGSSGMMGDPNLLNDPSFEEWNSESTPRFWNRGGTAMLMQGMMPVDGASAMDVVFPLSGDGIWQIQAFSPPVDVPMLVFQVQMNFVEGEIMPPEAPEILLKLFEPGNLQDSDDFTVPLEGWTGQPGWVLGTAEITPPGRIGQFEINIQSTSMGTQTIMFDGAYLGDPAGLGM